MKNLIGILSLVIFAAVPMALNAAEILMIEGTIPGNEVIEMTAEDVALISVDAIAGSEIQEIKVEGQAKAKQYTAKVVGEVGPPVLGPANLKVLVSPSGKGEVKVSIVVKQPTADKPETTTYTFKVK